MGLQRVRHDWLSMHTHTLLGSNRVVAESDVTECAQARTHTHPTLLGSTAENCKYSTLSSYRDGNFPQFNHTHKLIWPKAPAAIQGPPEAWEAKMRENTFLSRKIKIVPQKLPPNQCINMRMLLFMKKEGKGWEGDRIYILFFKNNVKARESCAGHRKKSVLWSQTPALSITESIWKTLLLHH